MAKRDKEKRFSCTALSTPGIKEKPKDVMANKKPNYWTSIYWWSNYKTYCSVRNLSITGVSLLAYVSLCDERYLKGIKRKSKFPQKKR